ncbi:hypothetical protein [Thauera humireducens]|uniref:hypothetical protein n=1 Tax=Thauera humireducens TaxID=1134435 RepID=UPI000B0CF565|nr:hypothetical protein [Thauera humireducens]
MSLKAVAMVCGLAVFSFSFADDSFESIAGFRLGQDCTGSKFTKKQSEARNPDDPVDAIDVLRNQHQSKTTGGHTIYVSCSIIDNKIDRIYLTSTDSDAILKIKSSLQEKMGRAPDGKDSIYSKPQRLLGLAMDGHKMEFEHWNLSGNRKATAYTQITQPYGSNSISDLKWKGGIELSYSNASDAEWKHLKQLGMMSSKQREKLDEEVQKENIKGLLE